MSRKKWEMPKGSGRSASGFGKPLAIGIGISMALTLGLSAFFATLMDRQMLGQEMTGALAIGILAVSVAAGAWSAAKLAGSKPMVICLLVGGGDLLMLFLYVEILSMVKGAALGTREIPIHTPIALAIVAVARYIVVDVEHISPNYMLFTSSSILVLVLALWLVRKAPTNNNP